MAIEEEYELLPHEELEELRNEVAKLKKNPLGEDKTATDLLTAVQDMTVAMNSLTHLLTQTNEEMLHEFRRSSMQENFTKLSSQNEKIAQGILGVAHLVKQGVVAQPTTTIDPSPASSSPVSPQPAVIPTPAVAPAASSPVSPQSASPSPAVAPAQPAVSPAPAPSTAQPVPNTATSIVPDPGTVMNDPFSAAPPPPPPASSARAPANPMAAFETSQQLAPPPAAAPSMPPPSGLPPAPGAMPPPLDLAPAPGLNVDPNTPNFEFPPPEGPAKKKGVMGMFK